MEDPSAIEPDWDRDDDREPEPPEQDESPLDLVAARAVLAAFQEESCVLGHKGREALDLLPVALDEVEALRRELAYWRGLPMREEYAVTEDGKAPDAADTHIRYDAAEEAERHAGTAGHLWTRSLTEHPWVGLVNEPPF
ncbi:hypothetical protein ACFFWE_09355 [Sphaerisporangium melleum]|nr:hypothetical protein [Sphaerisporangium melleum]